MSLNKVIPFTSCNNHKYLIKLEEFYSGINFSLPVVNITLVLIDTKDNVIEFKDLIAIAKIIVDYIKKNDVILYYYCDHTSEDITLSKRHEQMLPQEFRSRLFSLMFSFMKRDDILKDEIVIKDENQIPHYISLIAREEHKSSLTEVNVEIQKMNDK